MKLDVQTITTICLLLTIGLLGYLIHLMNPQAESYDKVSCGVNNFCDTTAKVKCGLKGVHTCSCGNCSGTGKLARKDCNYTCN